MNEKLWIDNAGRRRIQAKNRKGGQTPFFASAKTYTVVAQDGTSQDYVVTVTVVPGITALSPANNGADVKKDADLVVTFCKNVFKGTGNIVIRELAVNTDFETVAVTSNNVSITNNVVTITHGAFATKQNAVRIAGTCFVDVAGNVSAVVGGWLTVDNTAPTGDIVDVSPDPRSTVAVKMTVTYSEAVMGVGISNFSLTRNGSNVDLTGEQYTHSSTSGILDLSGATISGDGEYVLTMNPSGIHDGVGNSLSATVTDSWTVDSVRPTVTISSIRANPTKDLTPIKVTITFSENVTWFEAGDIMVTSGSLSDFAAVSASEYSFYLTVTGNGHPKVDVAANVTQDAAGNNNTAAAQYTHQVSGADGSDVAFNEGGVSSIYVLVPCSTLPGGTVVPAFYCGKYPATGSGTTISGPSSR